MPHAERPSVAVIGMACVFPGAPDARTFWRNIRDGVDATTEAAPERLDPVYYSPEGSKITGIYCHRVGAIDGLTSVDLLEYGLMPVTARQIDPDQLLTLETAAQALRDAGYDPHHLPTPNVAVILGRGGYPMHGMIRALSVLYRPPVTTEAEAEAVKPMGPDAVFGLVPNFVASRISNRLGLIGPAFTVDAACASSLLAVDQACASLLSGSCDMALSGGVFLNVDSLMASLFCQLEAMSRSQCIRPFDRRADGVLVGEGAGILVLRRLEDALRDDNHIYAVIRGVGSSSDGRGTSMINPNPESQVISVLRAWDAAQLDRHHVGLIEGHGTATQAGDTAELQCLAAAFGPAEHDERRAVLGSVKSMIGHAMPAAGAAGLIKAIMAVHEGILPPTLHCEEPHPLLDQTRFRVLTQSEPWDDDERYAGVSAFGFGGINCHVVLTNLSESRRSKAPSSQPAPASRPPQPRHRLELALNKKELQAPPPAPARAEGLLRPPSLPSDDPVLAEVMAFNEQMVAYQQWLVDLYAGIRTEAPSSGSPQLRPVTPAEPPPAVTTGNEPLIVRRRLSVQDTPALLDHCLVRQPPGWPDLASRLPCPPMTMILELIMEVARELFPDQVVVAIKDAAVFRAMIADQPLDLVFQVYPKGDELEIQIEGYAGATVCLAPDYPPAPPPEPVDLTDEKNAAGPGFSLYERRLLFHGPLYQCITRLSALERSGSSAELKTPPAPGGLLDGLAQLFGHWCWEMLPIDNIVLPIFLGRIDFFGPHPQLGSRLQSAIWIDEVTPALVQGRAQLVDDSGRCWCRAKDWRYNRMKIGAREGAYAGYPEKYFLAQVATTEYALFDESQVRMSSTDWISTRYVSEDRYAWGKDLRSLRRFNTTVVAVKDAARRFLKSSGHRDFYPVELTLRTMADGQATVRLPDQSELSLVWALEGTVAVARVVRQEGESLVLGFRERWANADPQSVLTAGERELVPSEQPQAWLARVLCAKTLIEQSPRHLWATNQPLEVTEQCEDAVKIGDRWVRTAIHGEAIVAWESEPPRRASPPPPAMSPVQP